MTDDFAIKLQNRVDSCGILNTKFGFRYFVINPQTSPIALGLSADCLQIPTVLAMLVFGYLTMDTTQNLWREKEHLSLPCTILYMSQR